MPRSPLPTPSPTTTTLPDGTVVPISKPVAPVRIVNIEEAVLPTAPLPSNSGLLLVVGGVLGLAVGLLAASLREAFDRRVRGPKDIASVARIPILGDIPADRALWTTPLVARSGAGAPIAEAFRALRAHLDYVRARDGRRSFVLTAAGPRQGTTTITANLAVAMANTATSVVVVDADLRSSALSRLFGIHGALGLTEVLSGRTTLDAALHSSDGGRLMVLPAGGRPSNPGELLATPTMREVLVELRRRFEVVLIDAPAISEVTDAAVLGSFDSSTLLVLAQGTTTRPRLEDALGHARLGRQHARRHRARRDSRVAGCSARAHRAVATGSRPPRRRTSCRGTCRVIRRRRSRRRSSSRSSSRSSRRLWRLPFPPLP